MSDHPIDPRDILISLVAAALTAAEADAAAPDSGLIFRPEWCPTPRTRSYTSQPQGAPGANQSLSWASHIRNQLLQLQQDQPLLSPDPTAKPTLPSASVPPPTSTPPPPASVPALPLSPGRLPPPQPQLLEDVVAELLKKNQDVFDEVINHPFPRAFGKGTASLDGFRYYMIQDKLYLETCARLKMVAVAASPNFEDVETFEFRHKSSNEYVKKLEEICITMLGIPESTIKTTPRSVELDASERFYKDSLRNEDALLGYYVVLLPCILTYWRIAERLMNDPSTAKNVVYHPAWTVVNYDPSSVGKYTKFINENIAAKGGIDRWNYIFRIACQLEAKLFNTGLQASTPFQIIPDGTYSIHISSVESVVLAVQNVEDFLRPPLDKLLDGYFPSDAGSSVVGMNRTGGDNERWHVVATKAGYTFQNLGTGLYLGISTESDREESRILQAVFEPYYWWINPVSSQPDQGLPVYQIYDSANLRHTLHADIEVLNSIGSTNFCYTPIIAHENSEVPCQMWSFNDKLEQLEHAQICPDDHKWAEYRNAELGKQLQQAQAMNAGFEAERAIYMRENDLLRQELEEVRLANLAAAQSNQEQQAYIQSLVEEAQKEKEATDQKYRDLFRSMPVRAQICHWESFSGIFYSASFNPAPIESGVRDDLPASIIRYKSDYSNGSVGIHSAQEGLSFTDTDQNGIKFWDFQVLVGDPSRLQWASCHGRFEVESIGYNPVPGWDKEAGEVLDTHFIARFSHSGNVYSTTVTEGADGVSQKMDGKYMAAQDYEVLCYKDF